MNAWQRLLDRVCPLAVDELTELAGLLKPGDPPRPVKVRTPGGRWVTGQAHVRNQVNVYGRIPVRWVFFEADNEFDLLAFNDQEES